MRVMKIGRLALHNAMRRLIPMLVLGVVGNTTLYLIPLLVGAMVTDRGFTPQQAGFIASADIAGFAMSTLFTALLLDRFENRRIAIIGVMTILLANVWVTTVYDLIPFAAIRLISGAGCGILVAIATVALGREDRPDRNFGLFYAASLLFATGAFWVLPPVIAAFHLNSIYWLLVGLAILAGIATLHLPKPLAVTDGAIDNMQQTRWGSASIMLLAIMIFLAQQGALWAYVERIGNSSGLSGTFIGLCLGIATLTGFAGASMVAWIGSRGTRLKLLLAGTAIQIISLTGLSGQPSAGLFLVAAAVLALCWNVINPIQLGILSDLDSSGRALALSATATGLGMALGPTIGALSLDSEGYDTLLKVVGFLAIFSLALMIPMIRISNARLRVAFPRVAENLASNP